MKHPFRETAELLREQARTERRLGGKWANIDLVRNLNARAAEYERLARADEHWPPPRET